MRLFTNAKEGIILIKLHEMYRTIGVSYYVSIFNFSNCSGEEHNISVGILNVRRQKPAFDICAGKYLFFRFCVTSVVFRFCAPPDVHLFRCGRGFSSGARHFHRTDR